MGVADAAKGAGELLKGASQGAAKTAVGLGNMGEKAALGAGEIIKAGTEAAAGIISAPKKMVHSLGAYSRIKTCMKESIEQKKNLSKVIILFLN